MTLDKPAPWDQVLDLVLKMNDLGMKMEGDIIRIATLAKLAQEQKLEAKKLEEAQKRKKQEDLITAFIPINYASAAEVAKSHIHPIASKDRKVDGASVTVDTRLEYDNSYRCAIGYQTCQRNYRAHRFGDTPGNHRGQNR